MAVQKLETFERDIRVATAGLAPQAIQAELARFARAELRAVIESGEASSTYDRFVNGRKGAPEDSVVPPGPIIYVFAYWSQIIRTALEELRKRVPVRSGRYSNGFMVLANGQPVRQYSDIPPGAEVIILNVRPYTRKMETGANKTGRDHFGNTKAALNRRFREVAFCEMKFLQVSAGLHPSMPYILKVGGALRAAKQNRMSSAFRSGRSTLSRRPDRQPGQPITYPALVLNMVN